MESALLYFSRVDCSRPKTCVVLSRLNKEYYSLSSSQIFFTLIALASAVDCVMHKLSYTAVYLCATYSYIGFLKILLKLSITSFNHTPCINTDCLDNLTSSGGFTLQLRHFRTKVSGLDLVPDVSLVLLKLLAV